MPLDSLILDQHGQPARRVTGGKGQRPRAALGGGWDAGQIGRRLSAVPTAARSINTLIRSYGGAVLARSRYLAANNPYAASAREAYVSAMVGQGIIPAPQLDDPDLKATINQVWADWTDEADADWITDFYGLQSIVAGELFEAGEVFVRFRPRLPGDGLTVPLQLQVLPAEMLDVHWNLALDNGGRIECGIEFDAIGRRKAYHFWSVFPGTDVYFGKPAFLRVPVPADQVLHIYRPIRAGQVRGIPHTLSMISTLALLDLYDDAELERKRIAYVARETESRHFEHRIDEGRVRIGENEHVALLDLGKPPDTGPVKPYSVLEKRFVQPVCRYRVVLPDSGQIHELEVDHLDVPVLHQLDHILRCQPHPFSPWLLELLLK